jgi:hypothetical protein
MAEDKKPKVPDFVTRIQKKQKIYNHWTRNRKNYVQESFDSALKHMQDLYKKTNADSDDIDVFEHVSSDAFKKKFLAKFHSTIIDKLKDQYRFDKKAKISDTEKDFHDDMVLDVMTGMSRDDLDSLYSNFVDNYNSVVESAQQNEQIPQTMGEYFSGGNFANQFINAKKYSQVRQKLQSSIFSHIKHTSIDDILGYTGLKEYAQRELIKSPYELLGAIQTVARNDHKKISSSDAPRFLKEYHKDYIKFIKDNYKATTDEVAKIDKLYTPKDSKKAA